MEDPHRKPGDRDRSRLATRIRRAADQGRISAADRDIRLGNVASAHSMSELDLMGRELDQLEASVQAGTTAPAWATGSPVQADEELADKAAEVAKSTARSIGVMAVLLLALALAGAGASAFFVFRASSDTPGPDGLQDPLPLTPEVSTVPAGPSGTEATTGTPAPTYSLTGPGIRAFLKLYRQTFKTSLVVDLTMYSTGDDDYVVVNVPVPGKARHEGWLYRNDSGFTSFGGVRANFPGARPVDTDRLNIAALVRNIARARSTLDVEDPTTTYASVRHYNSSGEAPSVNVYVTNEFNESGYLATTLDGKVERALPYAAG